MLLDKPKTAGPINIRSPFGLISVRGTRLFAGPSKGVFGVFVVNGAVTVAAAGKTVTVQGGFRHGHRHTRRSADHAGALGRGAHSPCARERLLSMP